MRSKWRENKQQTLFGHLDANEREREREKKKDRKEREREMKKNGGERKHYLSLTNRECLLVVACLI